MTPLSFFMRTLALFLSSALLASAQFSIQTADDSVTIKNNQELVTRYRIDSKVPYLYPLSAPGGSNLSRHWPMEDDAKGEEKDHPHHRSLWLSHGAVNGFDFWSWKGKGDPRIVHLGIENQKANAKSATFSVRLAWRADGNDLLEEMRSYNLEDLDADTRIVDVTSTLKAANGDVLFGDTKEGFFAFRVDRTLRLKGATAKGGMLDSHGRKNDNCWGKRAAYVAFHGPDEEGKATVICMMDHPSNLRHETWWHARDYGLLAANPFGIHDFEAKKDKTIGNHTLKDGESMTFRYRLVLHRGERNEAKIANWWESYRQL